jgi:hypothetical protein
MSDPEAKRSAPKQDARLGLCYGLWRSSKKKELELEDREMQLECVSNFLDATQKMLKGSFGAEATLTDGVEKDSYIETISSEIYFAIDLKGKAAISLGNINALDALGDQISTNVDVDTSGRFILLIHRPRTLEIEQFEAGTTKEDAISRATKLVSNRRNAIQEVQVGSSTSKTFGGNPVYKIFLWLYVVLREINNSVDTKTIVVHESASNFVEAEVVFKSYDDEKGIVYGVVYEPFVKDAHGDWATPYDIEQAAHGFLPNAMINIHHKSDLPSVRVVESYLAPVTFNLGKEVIKKGTWVMAVHINEEDQELREAVKNHEIGGFSLEGWAERV